MGGNAYFASRVALGQRFAEDLLKLRYEDAAVLALSPGGGVIAIEIAKKLHAISAMLLLENIHTPGDIRYGSINDHGQMTLSNGLSVGEAEEFKIEYRNSLEQEKREALTKLHIIGHSGKIEPTYFNGRNIIIVNDISRSGTSYQAALDFLKPARLESVTLVAGVAMEQAADVMHHLGDKVLIAHRTDKNFPTSHYFDDDTIPTSDELNFMMAQIVLQW